MHTRSGVSKKHCLRESNQSDFPFTRWYNDPIKRVFFPFTFKFGLVIRHAFSPTRIVTDVLVPLPVPDRPTLPTVVADDLQCLGNQTYEDMVARDAMLQAHIKRLEAIILTTNTDSSR